jgi:hypothetical protein
MHQYLPPHLELLKDDRIVLRNKMKEYLRAIRENRLTENEEETDYFNQLLQIFVEADKKKSLGKIQRGDRAMDWLQIKLRKFIDSAKKERHRRELENFRKGKFIEAKNHGPSFQKETRAGSRQALAASRGSNYRPAGSRQAPAANSLSRSREHSQLESSRRKEHNQSYAHYSYHKNFSFLRKGNEPHPSRMTRPAQQQRSSSNSQALSKRVSNLNRSLDQLSRFSGTFHPSKARQPERGQAGRVGVLRKNEVRKVARDEQEMSQQEINKLTRLFSEQLNSEPQKPSPQAGSYTRHNPYGDEVRTTPMESVSARERPAFEGFTRYEESSQKIQQMLEGSKHILDSLHKVQPEPQPMESPQMQIHPLNPPSKHNYD